MIAAIERMTGLHWKGQGPAVLVAGGHGATHWIVATFYVLVPFIREDLGLTYTEVGGFTSIFFAASFAFNAGSGPLVDITGRRVLLQAMALIVGAASLMIMGLAEGVWLIVAMLMIIGCTNNLWHPAAISYLSDRYPGNRGYVLSIHTLGASFGDMLAPLAAGIVLVWMSWQDTATLSALPVFAVAVTLFVMLGGGGARAQQPSDAEQRSNPQPISARAYIDGIVGLVRNGAILGVCLMAAFRSMAQNGLLIFVPLLLVDVLNYETVLMGLALTIMQIGGMPAGLIAGIASDRIGRRPIVLPCMALTTLVIFGVSFVEAPAAVLPLLFLLGFALFAVRPVIHSWSLDLAPREMGGSVISLLFGSQAGFSAIVPIVGGMVADTWGLVTVFYLLAGCMAVATFIVYLLPSGKQAA